MTICVAPFRVLWFPDLGGHAWVYINWCLGLQDAGCKVIWLDGFREDEDPEEALQRLANLRQHLAAVGFTGDVALLSGPGGEERFASVREELARLAISWEEAAGRADLLLNFHYNLDNEIIGRFRRRALIDIDPGLFQLWLSEGQMRIGTYDRYFSIGETVGRSDAHFPSCGLKWHYTPPPVYLPAWPNHRAPDDAPYTTVSNWWSGWESFRGEVFNNEKRTSFLEYIDLPERVDAHLELALYLSQYDGDEQRAMEEKGWRIRHAREVSATPVAYHDYILGSRGEYSCAKPSCMKLANAWISDRTLCYLASGKPAVVQHTGKSTFLPDAAGLFRFRNMEEAVRAFALIEADYELQSRQAFALAEAYFDARKVVTRVLETALAPSIIAVTL
jgi:hypothetical protein